MRQVSLSLAMCGALALSNASAEAAVVTFEGYGSNTIFGDEFTGNGLDVALSDGYEFTSSGDHFHLGSGLVGVPSNGTGILLQDRDYFITMRQVGGSSFNLLSADLGEDVSFGGSALTIRVTGLFASGGSTFVDVVLDGNATAFQNTIFAGFTDLSHVYFDGFGNSGVNSNGFTIDNVNVADVAPVPEPTTLLLLGTGLVAVTARRRSVKRT